ncbi:lysozyme inhibitor LprI family protein [Klebsiella spallanzanii]|uniref:lysozyme inhibitor LprI family protein n=1 Tax=Klebsiella spallanzanii TaxID=2587528 RepID=UPI0011680B01|nr:hypothetical protein [Klebsiella spallanzanii]VUS56606.1 hypothetical protein SB6419_00849 [Klebsiella spallanzanii]
MELTCLTNNSKKLICSLGLFIISQPAGAAGFDCSAQNLNKTELTICNDTYLSSVDNVLNLFFTSALNNSINHGTLFREQRQWVKERNQCEDDISCIKEKYVARNKDLTTILPFRNVDDVFDRDGDLLDPPMAQNLQNKNGFTITEDRWRVKVVVPEWVISSRNYKLDDSDWRVLTHRVVKGDLIIYFLVSGREDDKQVNYIVRVENDWHSQIVAHYKFSGHDDVMIKYDPGSTDKIVYSVIQRPDPELADIGASTDYTVETYTLDPTSDKVEKTQSTTRSEASLKKEAWVGYCETQECTSRVVSPDGKWRLASRDGSKSDKDEGMFYFPADKPDQGINVFLAQGDTSKLNIFEYMRNYVWGDENSFYFDNEGVYACIWKTDIKNKITQRILPVEGMLQPYYLNYNDEDLVVATYHAYSAEKKREHYEIYIAKK